MTSLFKLLFILSVIAGAHDAVAAADRIALVVGNSNYENVSELRNPLNDATAVAASLERLNFDVTLITNVTKATFETALADFSEKTDGAAMALVYYAGHAMEMNGENYLIPVEATLKSDSRIAFETVTLHDLQQAVDGVEGLKLIILDSCRDNPFQATMKRQRGTRSAMSRGLARPDELAPGLLISYAAAAGTTADDGDGRHSPYTMAFLENVERPGLEINMLFRSISASVKKQTAGKQTPFKYDNLSDDAIYLVPPPADKSRIDVVALPPSSSQKNDTCGNAGTHWTSIKDLSEKEVFLEHIQLFPNCGFARLAKSRIEVLEKTTKPAPEAECDRLAARPEDPQRIASVKGVEFQDIVLPRANKACEMAIKEFPNEPRFQFQIGRTLDREKNYPNALTWYRKAADRGSASAMVGLGVMYEAGNGVDKNATEAVDWYRKAASAGHSTGMLYLGTMYAAGSGVDKNDSEALSWYRRSADAGNRAAMRHIAISYENGAGVDKDEQAAAQWYRKAAEAEDIIAISNLAHRFETGRGVSRDLPEAVRWYRLSANAGDPLALNNLGNLYDKGQGVSRDPNQAADLIYSALKKGGVFSRDQMKKNSAVWSQEFRIAMQQRLTAAGVYNGAIDGSFGPATFAAIDAVFNSHENAR